MRLLVRTFRRSPSSALAAVLTLSLTLGAGASIFAIADAVLLTPLPFADPDALVRIGETPIDDRDAEPRAVPYDTFERWRERAAGMAMLEASDGTNLTLTGLGAAERVQASNTTPGFLALLGVTPARGRAFEDGDIGRPIAIVSARFWRATLGSDPDVVGRPLVLGGQAHTIVGVLPEQFQFALQTIDIWRPFPAASRADLAGFRVFALARLTRGVSAADLAAALGDVSRASSPPSRAAVTTMSAETTGRFAVTLRLLAMAAGLAILIAFVNLAGLLTVRSIDRRRELAVRSALGARPAQIARIVLTEAQVIVSVGVLGGVLLALWLTPVLSQLVLDRLPATANRSLAVSWRAVAAIAAAASVCAWLSALLPAAIAARRSVVEVLRRGVTPQPRERSLRRVFVVAEVALAFVLLASVMLLGRSLFRVLSVDPGFDAGGVIVLKLSLPSAKYDTSNRIAGFYSALQGAIENRLGGASVGIIDELPLTGDRGRLVVRTTPAAAGRDSVVRAASRGYFEVMRIPVIAGRSFDARDDAGAAARVIVDESLARNLFPSQTAIGRTLYLGDAARPAEIVGVVGDVKHRALDEAATPTLYVSALQVPSNSNVIVVRSSRPDADVVTAVRTEAARLDPDLPVYGVLSMTDVVELSPGVRTRRMLTATFSGCAFMAVLLAGIGLVGLAAHDVASRRAELALRIALGANPARIFGAALGQSALVIVIGLAAGGLLSVWTVRALGAVVVAADGLSLAGVAGSALLLAIAGACAVLPAARRAARTDPLIALRSE